eukprot:757721-Hanusia_phi.AAC.6
MESNYEDFNQSMTFLMQKASPPSKGQESHQLKEPVQSSLSYLGLVLSRCRAQPPKLAHTAETELNVEAVVEVSDQRNPDLVETSPPSSEATFVILNGELVKLFTSKFHSLKVFLLVEHLSCFKTPPGKNSPIEEDNQNSAFRRQSNSEQLYRSRIGQTGHYHKPPPAVVQRRFATLVYREIFDFDVEDELEQRIFSDDPPMRLHGIKTVRQDLSPPDPLQLFRSASRIIDSTLFNTHTAGSKARIKYDSGTIPAPAAEQRVLDRLFGSQSSRRVKDQRLV